MTPFAVVCPTCGAKLVVTKAEQIGEVELCPSCRSMVLIEPPAGSDPRAAASPTPPLGPNFLGPEGEEATETNSLLSNSLDDGVTDSVDVGRAEAVEADRARGKRSRFLVDEAVPPPTSDSGRHDAPRHDSPPGGIPVPPAAPNVRPQPRRIQHALTLAAATVTGIGVAAILFVIVVIATRSRPQDVATNGADPPVVPATDDPDGRPPVEPDPGPDEETVPVEEEETPVDPPAVVEVGPPVDEGDDPAPPADPAADPASDAADPPPENDPEGMPAEAPVPDNDAPPAAPTVGEAPPIFGASDPTAPPPAPADSEAAELAELLERIAPGSSRDPFAAEDPAAAANSREREEDLAALRAVMIELVNAGGDEAERPPLREVDVEERLADPIVRVRATDLSIDQFLHQITAISAIPLQWDPDVRRLARLKGDARVTVRIDEATTVGALLDAGVGQVGFGAVPREGYVEILKGERPLELREDTIPWEEVPIPAALREEFVAKIRTWIDANGWGEDPAGRTIAATEAGIVVRQIENELFKIDLLIDRLRMTMGQEPAHGTPTELLDPQPAHLRGTTILEQPAELVALRPIPLEQALFDLSQSSGLAIAVEWNGLLASGWGPMSETTFEAPKAPLRETLATSLRKLGLGYRTVDEGTVQVLSPEALALGVEIEIYRLDESIVEGDPAKFIETLTSELNAALGEGFNAGQGLWISPADRLLVAALPRPAQVWLHRRLNPAAKTASR